MGRIKCNGCEQLHSVTPEDGKRSRETLLGGMQVDEGQMLLGGAPLFLFLAFKGAPQFGTPK